MHLATMTSVCPDWTLDEIVSAMKRHGYRGLEPRVEWDHAAGIEASLTPAERRAARDRLRRLESGKSAGEWPQPSRQAKTSR